jgi:hypothetical protein
MKNKEFDRIKKTLIILLVLCFAQTASAALASAADNSNYGKDEDGFKDGYNKGFEDGKIQGQIECEQYGNNSTLSKIPSPFNDNSWSQNYRDNYNNGYEKGYIDGYNQSRYGCLK